MNFHKVLSADSLADFTDEDVLELQKPDPLPVRANNRWWMKYKLARYRWRDLVAEGLISHPAWVPIKLTKGYFMVVLLKDHLRTTLYPDGSEKTWHSHVTYDKKTGEVNGVYACRRGRGIDEPKTVYAHRELLDVLMMGLGDVDHANAESLDNRGLDEFGNPVNLFYCSKRIPNIQNCVRTRKEDLPTGVERKKNGRFGGIRCVRNKPSGPGSVTVIRSRNEDGSPLDWATPEEARQWYLDELQKLHQRDVWAHNPVSVNYIKFPPTRHSLRRANLALQASALADTF